MNKNVKIYIAAFVAVVGLMMYLEYTQPKPIDWRQTWSIHDKIPFGAYVLAHELPKIFPDKEIQFIEDQTVAFYLTDYNHIYDYEYNEYENDDYYDNDETTESIVAEQSTIDYFTDGTYLMIEDYSHLTDADQNELLQFVEHGNDAFLAAGDVAKIIADSLKLGVSPYITILESEYKKVKFHLTNAHFDDTVFQFSRRNDLSYFDQIDTANVTVLGYFTKDNTQRINFIKQKYGKGTFYINLFPYAFGNYYLLNDSTYSYSINCLNYIEKSEIFWNEYKKSINQPAAGLLMHIFRNPPLHWAWVILIATAILYMLFFGKRLQRIIPIVKPLQNTTVEFTKTVGNLYFNNRQHGDLLLKKVKYFLYFVKEKYFMQIENIDSEFSELLHLKSGVSRQVTDRIVFLINKNKNPEYTTEADLKEVNEAIDTFTGQ
ncbi:MAG: DUF4350 domain-containing protein [Prevotellaceae bacterium]|nr:DUF4350 domain-containing protein [Prevotellaceae bacterium]